MAENGEEKIDDLDEVLSDKFQELSDEGGEGNDNLAPATADKTPAEKPGAEAQKETDQTDETKEIGTAPAQAAIQAPISWSADDKAKWAAIPPDLQVIIANREKQRDTFLTQKSNEFTQQMAPYKEIDHALAPVEQILKREGINKAQAVKELVAYYQHYESNPASYILQVAQSKGIDLRTLVEKQGQIDPNKQALQQYGSELSTIKQELNEFKSQKAQEQTEFLLSEVDKFKSEPGHEHFDAVRVQMGKLIEIGEATSMQDAYDKAVWANSDTRTLELKKQEDERVKNSSEKAKKARKVAGPKLSTKEFSSGKATEAADEDEFLREQFRKIQSA